jgi:hypothetical protein
MLHPNLFRDGWKIVKVGMPVFQPFYEIKLKTSKFKALKCSHFEASEIMTKFKSQGLYIIRIKYLNASGRGPPPSLIPTLWNIGILHYKQAKMCKDMQHSVHITHVRS